MKYKLTDETIDFFGHTLHRIEALKDFGDVHKGDKGGFIESEHNLSQNGDCWVYDNAIVCGNAKVYGNAEVYDSAEVYGNAEVYGSAKVYDRAKVCGSAKVSDWAKIGGDEIVCGAMNMAKEDI